MRRRTRGFTLIEVLVTGILMSLSLPPLMMGMSLAAQSAADARLRDQATDLAQSKLNEIVAGQLWQTQSMSGDFSPEAPKIHWQAAMQAWQPDQSGQDIKEVTLTVTWSTDTHGRTNSVVLSTLAYLRQPEQ